MSTILKVDDINVYYGSIHAIKGISFEVNEGEIVTLIGANGAGKSTTLNTISGLLHSKTGHIEFMGAPLNHVPSHKVVSKGLALVPEGRRIFLQMSVQENLDMGAFSRRGGNIDADPYARGPQDSACTYCAFASACYFDDSRDKRRLIYKTESDEFWALMERENGEEGHHGR